MEPRAIVDTGFLVALLNGNDRHHEWATGLLGELRGPWVTAEACVSETLFLLEKAGSGCARSLCNWLERELVQSRHFLPEDLSRVREELFRYKSRWVDFADGCLLVLSDRLPALPVVTVDRADFCVYFRQRKRRRLLIPAR